MNDNPTTIDIDSKGNSPSSSKRGMKFDSNFIPYVSGDFKTELILLSDDWEMEGSYGGSLSNEIPYRDSPENLSSEKLDKGENLVANLMPHLVFIEVEIQAARWKRKNITLFAKTYQGVTGQEPNDNEISRHLECVGVVWCYILDQPLWSS